MMIRTSIAALAIAAGSANAALVRSFVASADTPGDATWQNVGGNGSSANNFSFGTAVTPATINDPLAPGVTAAYDISETGAIAGTQWSFFGQAGGGRANNAANTFEVFFRMDDLSGDHIILEIGGSGAGISISVQDSSLIWASNPGGPNTGDTQSISTTIGLGWNYAAATWNRTTGLTSLYLNGSLIDTIAIDPDATGWVGGNEAGLGGLTSASVALTFDPASLTDFDGAISLFNYWNEELSASAIQATYDENFIIPAPGAATLFAAAGLMATRRRR